MVRIDFWYILDTVKDYPSIDAHCTVANVKEIQALFDINKDLFRFSWDICTANIYRH